MTTPDPSEPPVEARKFDALVLSLMAGRDPSLRYLGMTAEAGRALAELAGQTRSTVWSLQRMMSFYALRGGRPLDEAAYRRGVTSRLVVRPGSLHLSPMLSSYDPDVRVGPVSGNMMILDSRDVVLPGLDGESIWTSSDQDLVSLAVRAYEAVWAVSRPAVPEGEEPPLTARMVDIAWLLVDGATDRQISRELGISERTVSNDVREMGRRLGTSNRAHTIAFICGAPL